jgi:uncharacterized protein YeaO (DUF488 family)
MYSDFGEDYIKELKDQKSQVVLKLIAEAKTEAI